MLVVAEALDWARQPFLLRYHAVSSWPHELPVTDPVAPCSERYVE
jgi:hypothetical protein